ncbi:unnamed protein product, partial [marine sediment metagenome]
GREISDERPSAMPQIPAAMNVPDAVPGIANPGQFWEQVGFLYQSGQDGIADPFAATGAIPAVTSSMRDMTDVRFEVPEFVADKCTGCSACWTQCPDSAIPGVVNTVEEILDAGIQRVEGNGSLDKVRQTVKHVGNAVRKILKKEKFTTFAPVLEQAWKTVSEKLEPNNEKREVLDA